MQSNKDKLQKLINRVRGGIGNKADITTSLYLLIKNIGCLSDIIGREFEVEYDSQNRISKIKQLPIKIPTFIALLIEINKENKIISGKKKW